TAPAACSASSTTPRTRRRSTSASSAERLRSVSTLEHGFYLRSRAQVELSQHLPYVLLHRPAGDEERLGDLRVAEAVGCEARGAPLTRRERGDAADRLAAGSCAGRQELGPGALGRR